MSMTQPPPTPTTHPTHTEAVADAAASFLPTGDDMRNPNRPRLRCLLHLYRYHLTADWVYVLICKNCGKEKSI